MRSSAACRSAKRRKRSIQLPSLVNLPAGVRKIDAGDAERMKELFGSFGLAMVTGVLCVYFVLVLLFKDFMQPITILAALPLSVGGAFMALLIDRQIDVDAGDDRASDVDGHHDEELDPARRVRDRRDAASAAWRRTEALLDACRKRARPIVMTTLAMIAGMAPVAIGLDSDSSFRSPMAIAVIGGLITSTLLSLVVVPVVFTYVHWWKLLLLRLVCAQADARCADADGPLAGRAVTELG